jgi:hypothetical protein
VLGKKGPTEKCRPCSDVPPVHEECEGPDRCNCMLCRDLIPLIKELEEDWRWDERVKSWPP